MDENLETRMKTPLSKLRPDARAATPSGPWCGPTVVARLTGESYANIEKGYNQINPKYTIGKITTTWAADTFALLHRYHVTSVVLDPWEVLCRNPNPRATRRTVPTLTRILNNLEPGWFIVTVPGHIMLVERRPGKVYDTKKPCCFYYDNVSDAGVVGSRRGARWGSARVINLHRVEI